MLNLINTKSLFSILLLVFSFNLCCSQAFHEQDISIWEQNNAQVVDLYHQEQYSEAIPKAEVNKEWAAKKFKTTSKFYATSLNNLALLYKETRQYKKAERLFNQSLDIKAKIFGKNHIEYANTLNNLALLYEIMLKPEESELLYIQALKIAEDKLGQQSPKYAVFLNNLAQLYKNTGQYKKAEPLFVQALDIKEVLLGEKHLSYIKSLDNLAVLYKYMGQYKKAERLFNQSLDIKAKIFGKKHISYIISINELAGLYESMGKYEQAEEYYLQNLVIIEETLDETHLAYAATLNGLALIYENKGDYKEAESYYQLDLTITENGSGKNSLEYTQSLNNLGYLYQIIGQYEQAEHRYEQALKIKEDVVGKKHPSYATGLNNLALLYQTTGQFKRAESLYLQAMKIRETILGEKHPSYAESLNNLASLYQSMGKYEQAELFYSQALEIITITLGQNHPSYASFLNNLAELYSNFGQYERAEQLFIESLDVLNIAFGKKHPMYVNSINNLALLYFNIGLYEDADFLASKALNIRKELFGEQHPVYAASLNNQASLYKSRGLYKKAESLYNQSLKIIEESPSRNQINYATILYNLADLYRRTERYEQAESLFHQSLKIIEEVLGKEHPDYAKSLIDIAALHFSTKNEQEALVFLKQGREIELNNFRNNITFLSENQQLPFLEKINATFDFIASTAKRHASSDLLTMAYNNELLQKQLLLQTNQLWKKAIAESNSPTLNQLYKQLLSKSSSLNQQLTLPKSQRNNLHQLETEIEQLEKQLTQHLPTYKQAVQNLNTTYQDVKSALKSDEVAIEFTHFQYYNKDWTDTIYYAALVLRPDYTYPKMIILGQAQALNALLKTEQDHLNNLAGRSITGGKPIGKGYRYGQAIGQIIWSSLESLLEGVDKIYYAPSGSLHQIAFAGLPISNDGLLFQKYKLHQVGTTRELVTGIPTISVTKKDKWLLAGGINYSEEAMPLAANKTADLNQTITNNPQKHIIDTQEFTSTSIDLKFLEGTKTELDSLTFFLQQRNIIYTALEGRQVAEEYFHQNGNFVNTNVIHIGTHGFFIPAPQTQKEFETWGQIGQSGHQFQQIDRPLLRSGLMLSGANQAWTTGEIYPNRMDGIWTAQEISQLNLKNARLAVLSACETAKGKIEGNEGVFGLQRAFKLAGVDKLLVSLWTVDDAATNLYMQTFYKKWLNGGSAYEAYRKTQEFFQSPEVLKYHKDYDAAYYWAGFVLLE